MIIHHYQAYKILYEKKEYAEMKLGEFLCLHEIHKLEDKHKPI